MITGEGKMDFQTAFGKTPAGVAGMAKNLNKPVIAFTGAIGDIPGSSAFNASNTDYRQADDAWNNPLPMQAGCLKMLQKECLTVMLLGKRI